MIAQSWLLTAFKSRQTLRENDMTSTPCALPWEKLSRLMRNFILKRKDTAQKIQQLRGNKTDNVLLTEEDWEDIRLFVNGVEGNFVTRLQSKLPNLSMDDIRLKMPTKALALIYGINEKSIKQKLFVYKSKVGISGEKTSLRTFIEAF